MKNIALIAFILLALVQWIVPGNMIWEKEKTLDRGSLFKFETAPVDPNHPFIGKYVQLDFLANYRSFPVPENYRYDEKIFVSYRIDNRGYARITSISKKKPKTNDYLQTTVRYTNSVNDSSVVFFNLPFDRFYMEEYKAPRAEKLYFDRGRDSASKTYALVSIYRGDAVIKDVFINDTSIATLLQKGKIQ